MNRIEDSTCICTNCRAITWHTNIRFQHRTDKYDVHTGTCKTCGQTNLITIERKGEPMKFIGFHETTGVQNWRGMFPMNRMEQIKKETYYTNDGLEYHVATDDVKYLLSKLEIAEKALDQSASFIASMAAQYQPVGDNVTKVNILGLAEYMLKSHETLVEALRKIRE